MSIAGLTLFCLKAVFHWGHGMMISCINLEQIELPFLICASCFKIQIVLMAVLWLIDSLLQVSHLTATYTWHVSQIWSSCTFGVQRLWPTLSVCQIPYQCSADWGNSNTWSDPASIETRILLTVWQRWWYWAELMIVHFAVWDVSQVSRFWNHSNCCLPAEFESSNVISSICSHWWMPTQAFAAHSRALWESACACRQSWLKIQMMTMTPS